MNKEEINLNGEDYIIKGKYLKDLEEIRDKLKALEEKNAPKKNAKRFGNTETLKLVKALSTMLCIQSESVNEDYIVEKGISVVDPANVCCVVGKTEEAKRILTMFKSFEVEDKPEPKLDYKMKEGEIAKSKFSQEYILKIINILKITSDSIEITTNRDYPITIENKDFKFILAPRVENET